MFKLEKHLTKKLKNIIIKSRYPFTVANVAFEFNYTSGRTDVLATTKRGHLITFEAKLSRWREAMHQAYRNSSFSHYSYVVLPASATKNALKKEHEFKRRGIGLCSVDSSGIKVEISASRKRPIQPWLTKSALKYIEKA